MVIKFVFALGRAWIFKKKTNNPAFRGCSFDGFLILLFAWWINDACFMATLMDVAAKGVESLASKG